MRLVQSHSSIITLGWTTERPKPAKPCSTSAGAPMRSCARVVWVLCKRVCVCVSSWAVASVIFVVVQLVHWLQLHSHKSDHWQLRLCIQLHPGIPAHSLNISPPSIFVQPFCLLISDLWFPPLLPLLLTILCVPLFSRPFLCFQFFSSQNCVSFLAPPLLLLICTKPAAVYECKPVTCLKLMWLCVCLCGSGFVYCPDQLSK